MLLAMRTTFIFLRTVAIFLWKMTDTSFPALLIRNKSCVVSIYYSLSFRFISVLKVLFLTNTSVFENYKFIKNLVMHSFVKCWKCEQLKLTFTILDLVKKKKSNTRRIPMYLGVFSIVAMVWLLFFRHFNCTTAQFVKC